MQTLSLETVEATFRYARNMRQALRFASKILVTDDGCWIWTSYMRKTKGYGYVKLDGRVQATHRVSYAWKHGEIDAGLVIHHRCEVKLCVNPDHLVALTNSGHSSLDHPKAKERYYENLIRKRLDDIRKWEEEHGIARPTLRAVR